MFESLARSRTGMKVALGVGRAIPRPVAERVVEAVAGRLAADADSHLVRTARANRYVVSGGTLTGLALDRAVRENVSRMARFLYDLYHVLGKPEAENAKVIIDDDFHSFVERERTGGPFVYVGAHLGNFDLIGRVLGNHGWRMQVLTVAEPNAGYEWQNEMRDSAGFETTPVSIEALKQAARRLEAGKSVLTGLDRPLPEPDKVRPVFFGQPSALPLMHVRLAMRHQVPVVLLTGRLEADGRYSLLQSEPIPMIGEKPTPEALKLNAERCLVPLERWITDHPEQWVMPHYVWPDVAVPDEERS